MAWPDGIIKPDSSVGKELGFTSDKFDGYLWKIDDHIMISFIVSLDQGRGNLRNLFESIWKRGYQVWVPTPFPRMLAILKRLGFTQTFEYDDAFKSYVEIWKK